VNSKAKIEKSKSTAAVIKKIGALARSKGIGEYIQELLVELCRIDTTPNPDVSVMRDAENRCFQVLERELKRLAFEGGHTERRPINPDIKAHPNYSFPHFTKTKERPAGLSAKDTYAGRSNLVYVAPGNDKRGGQSVALNAHVDVVAPYFPPNVIKGVVFGRGACDDKGPVAAILTALRILSSAMAQTGLRWNRNVLAMFVVEEEAGGNGSLSLAIDRELKQRYDSVLVGECAGLKIYPANRGAVWYKAELKPPHDVSAFEMSAFVVEEMEKEGASIRAESRHQLFPQCPVQTCHGIIGPFGEHPSRICSEVSFLIEFDRQPENQTECLIHDCLESGLAQYIGIYGDKTKVKDATTSKPTVVRHYDIKRRGTGFEVAVHGATGHMGAIRERDGAITKMAHLVRSLVYSKAKLFSLAGPMRIELAGADGKSLILEGGQGFVPTHTMEEVMKRIRQAAQRGAEHYLRRFGRSESAEKIVTVVYEKLHNAAFDGDPNSPAMRNAIAAAKLCGIWRDEPVAGWTVSCDARLFATEYPGMPVLTFGPGELAFAHSDQEQIALRDVAKAAEFLALFLLRQTGTI
jgi:acetylornithine deacetylase/succinyl-diaminopimelate desuccinylase-like protein